MIHAYAARNGKLFAESGATVEQGLSKAVWIDVVDPTPGEDKIILDQLGIDIPPGRR